MDPELPIRKSRNVRLCDDLLQQLPIINLPDEDYNIHSSIARGLPCASHVSPAHRAQISGQFYITSRANAKSCGMSLPNHHSKDSRCQVQALNVCACSDAACRVGTLY